MSHIVRTFLYMLPVDKEDFNWLTKARTLEEEKNSVIKIANFYSLLLSMLQQSVKQQLAKVTIGQMPMCLETIDKLK